MINKDGVDLLKYFEGNSLVAYQDSVGIWTIGVGHAGPDVYEHLEISQGKVEDLLQKDIYSTCKILDPFIREDVNENQFSALICLAFNVGPYAVKKSKVLSLVNCHEDPASEWLTWDHAGGAELAGLKSRRAAEVNLYNKSL